MDQKQIEELILSSTQAESGRRQHAIELLDRLRGDPVRWSVGLMLFFDGSTPLSKFFGLSLIREYMSSDGGTPPVAERQKIREAMMAWLSSNASNQRGIESYVVNSIVTIVTLAIKHDFPELWPTAFSDILTFGQKGINELDISIRVLSELEVEVVMFNDARSKEEIAHNTIVKDAIRAGPIAGNIVHFLCQSAVSVRPVKASLSSKCLIALSEMIGWIDNGLIVNQSTLTVIYQSLVDQDVAEAGLTCLLELVKKGMDPYLKIQMVASINLLPMLATVKVVDPFSRAVTPTSGALPRRTRGLSLLSDDESTDGTSIEDDITRELAAVLDVLLLELIGCWAKYEDHVIASVTNLPSSTSEQALIQSGPVLTDLLNATLPLVLQVFTVGDFYAAEAVVPSLNKFIALLKHQQTKGELISKMLESGVVAADKYFVGTKYLTSLLSAVCRQMQYPVHFRFDSDGDDEMAELEAKKQIRKLFVNCCRVHPSECLQMVTTALSSLPQPLSQGPFPPLEAVLKLVHAFAECGSYFGELVASGVFPRLIGAIHSTDVVMHRHPQVVMAYFEICSRYARLTPAGDVQNIVSNMVGACGLRHADEQLRNRTAYLLLKLVEAVPANVCASLIPAVSSFSDIILLAPGSGAESKGYGFAGEKSCGGLRRQSELYLLEAVGIMTSSFDWSGSGEKSKFGADGSTGESPTASMLTSYIQQSGGMNGTNSDPSIPQAQVRLMAAMLEVLTTQLKSIAGHPDISRCVAELGDVASHKLASIAALCRGHSYKKSPGSNPQYDQFQDAISSIFGTSFEVVSAICQSPLVQHRPVRDRGSVYYHRMLQVLGMKILPHIRDSYLCFVSNADASDIENIIQLANSVMVEFGSNATGFVDEVLGSTLDRIGYLYSDEGCAASTAAALAAQAAIDRNSLTSDTVIQAPLPSLETTRILLQRQYLGFLQHIATYNCHPALTSARNMPRLDSIFQSVIQGLNGGGDGISAQGGIALRRAALAFLSELIKDWVISEDSESVVDGSGGRAFVVPPPPPQVSAAIASLLFETVLPQALTVCTGGTGLDMRGDVQSQGILVDTGVLICILVGRRPRDTQEYFRRVLLPGLGWHVNAVTPMLSLLDTKVPVGTFKESFKKLIRQNLGSKTK